jgi:hypothetical protein
MRTVFLSINVITALVLVAGDSPCQDTRVYRHPSLNIQFEAPPDWDRVARPEDELIYEVADPDGAVHVVLWYTTTEQGPQDYLRKMAQMKDLAVGERPSPAQIGDRDAWTLSGPGREGDAPVRMILAAIPDGKSAARPRRPGRRRTSSSSSRSGVRRRTTRTIANAWRTSSTASR